MTPDQIRDFYYKRFLETKSVIPAFEGCDMRYTFGYERDENRDLIQDIFFDWILEKYGPIIANFSAPLNKKQLSAIENIIIMATEEFLQ